MDVLSPWSRCLVRPDGKRDCGGEAAYWCWVVPCLTCTEVLEAESCLGHPVCPRHGAELRAGALRHFDAARTPAVVTRIRSLG